MSSLVVLVVSPNSTRKRRRRNGCIIIRNIQFSCILLLVFHKSSAAFRTCSTCSSHSRRSISISSSSSRSNSIVQSKIGWMTFFQSTYNKSPRFSLIKRKMIIDTNNDSKTIKFHNPKYNNKPVYNHQKMYPDNSITMLSSSLNNNNNDNDDDSIENDNNNNNNSEQDLFYYNDFDGINLGTNNDNDNNNNNEYFDITRNDFTGNTDLQQGQQQQQQQLSFQLNERMKQVQRREEYDIRSIQRNWNLGNWNVQCLPLVHTTTITTSFTNTNTDITNNTITSTTIFPQQQQPMNDTIFITNFDSNYNKRNMGRSIPKVQQQQKQQSSPKVSCIVPVTTISPSNSIVDDDDTDDYDDDDDNNSNNMIIGWDDGTIQLVSTLSLLNNKNNPSTIEEEDDDEDKERVSDTDDNNKKNPKGVITNFKASNSRITAMTTTRSSSTSATTTDSQSSSSSFLLYSASENVGTIMQWFITTDNNDNDNDVLYKTNLHKSTTLVTSTGKQFTMTDNTNWESSSIFVLKVIQHNTMELLLSVSSSTFTLWDIQNTNIIYTSTTIDNNNEYKITSADTDGYNYVYIGTSNGNVIVYSIHDVLQNLPSSSSKILPCGQWSVSSSSSLSSDDISINDAITTILYDGIGTMGQPRGSSTTGTSTKKTSVLYTGTGKGITQKWELFERSSILSDNNNNDNTNSNSIIRIEQWPKLSSQRIPNSAHMFVSKYNTCVQSIVIVSPPNTISSTSSTNMLWTQQQSQQQQQSSSSNSSSSYMIVAYGDGTIKLWNIQNGKELYTIADWGDGKNYYDNDTTITTGTSTDNIVSNTAAIPIIRNVWLLRNSYSINNNNNNNNNNCLVSDVSIQSSSLYDNDYYDEDDSSITGTIDDTFSTTTTAGTTRSAGGNNNSNNNIQKIIKSFLCVYDFSIDNPEDDDNADYELDMPNYYQK